MCEMVCLNYRNTCVSFENHTKLEEYKDDFNLICRELDSALAVLETDVFKKKLQSVNETKTSGFLTVLLLKCTDEKLTLFVGINKNNNPYLFLYNNIEKRITNTISWKLFSSFREELFLGMLENKAQGLVALSNLYQNTPNLYESILKLIRLDDVMRQNSKNMRNIPAVVNMDKADLPIINIDSGKEIQL